MAPHVNRYVRCKMRKMVFYDASSDVEDIVQDTLLRASRASVPCDPRRPDAEIRGWFFRVATWSIQHYFTNKKRKRRIPRTYPLDDTRPRAATDPVPLEA